MSRFLAGLVMAVGLLVALTTGLCSLTFSALYVVGDLHPGPDGGVIAILIATGFLASAVGIWMFRRGRARMRRG